LSRADLTAENAKNTERGRAGRGLNNQGTKQSRRAGDGRRRLVISF
jgi:hypothetical protein